MFQYHVQDHKKRNIQHHNQIDTQEIFAEYQAFVKQKDADFNLKLGATEKTYFSNLLKATTCRNIWDNDIYYEILSIEDEYIQRAISEF